MRKVILIIFIFFKGMSVYSQKLPSREIDPDKLIQDLLRQQDLPTNYEEVYDVLYQYFLTPLSLNKTTREDLEGLYLLTPAEINSFLEYRIKFGALVSVYELQAIPGWDLSTIKKILPFVVVEEVFDKQKFLKRLLRNSNHYLLFRTDYVPEIRKGYMPDREGLTNYQGSPYKHLIRYRNSLGRDFSIGFTMEKDAGEEITWNPSRKQYLADYFSMHACLFNKGKWKAIGVGDYKLQFGQGLVLGGGFYVGKGGETILSVKKNSKGMLPYTSVLETDFFRGACITYAPFENLEVTGFYSLNKRDASVHLDSMNSSYNVTSLDDYGMHRTDDEIASKRNLSEQVRGGNVSLYSVNRKKHIGVTYVNTIFDKPILESDRIYNRFDFSGKKNSVMSLDYSVVVHNFNLFGEGAISSGEGKALLLGAIGSLSSKVDFSFLYRNYGRKFHSFYSNAFAEGSTTSNEQGYYWGLKIKAHPKWMVSLYYDYFIFPWLKFMVDNPSSGYGCLGRVQYSPSKKISMYLQLRYEEADKNQADNFTKTDYTVPSKKYNGMVNLDYKEGIFTFRSRVQWSNYRQSNSPTIGFAAAQDLTVDLHRVKISTRYALFDTEDYDNRQYVYEKDVLYAVSFPAYYGRGTRVYLITQLKITKRIDCWFRYAVTNYRDRQVIGSGWDEIDGNVIRELKLQLRYGF